MGYILPEREHLDDSKINLFGAMQRIPVRIAMISHMARFFGLFYKEREAEIWQIFGYRVASATEMEDCGQGEDVGGYHFYVFKSTPKIEGGRLLLGDGSPETRQKSDILGWGFHTSRFYVYALQEAMTRAYFACRMEAEAIRDRTGKDIVELLLEDTRWELKQGLRDYAFLRELASGPFVPICMKSLHDALKK